MLVKAKMLTYDKNVCSEHTDTANECAVVYSNIVTYIFLITNIEAHNYVFNELSELNDTQQKNGVT